MSMRAYPIFCWFKRGQFTSEFSNCCSFATRHIGASEFPVCQLVKYRRLRTAFSKVKERCCFLLLLNRCRSSSRSVSRFTFHKKIYVITIVNIHHIIMCVSVFFFDLIEYVVQFSCYSGAYYDDVYRSSGKPNDWNVNIHT